MKLLKEAGYADEVSEAGSAFYSSLYMATVEDNTREFLERFDRAFIFTVSPDRIPDIKKTICETTTVVTIPPPGVSTHAAEFRFKQLDPELTMPSPLLDIPPAHRGKAVMLLAQSGYSPGPAPLITPLIALHPGSGAKRKCWPLENYFELMKILAKNFDPFFIILAGPAEEPSIRTRIKQFIEAFFEDRKKSLFVSNEELISVAAMLRQCRLYIGNDSGITHLAGAAGSASIALFGPTDPSLWRPQGRNVHVVSPPFPGGPISAITVAEVYEKAREVLPD
ncbi:MAG: glycosyltransferase family 9 protein [Nitrospirae bacterium]|nr:glycosyltransferase family 9 protein [Nitrospirota bacterium]